MRKVNQITIPDEGRDKGKVFVITEAPAIIADKWGVRAMLALNRNGANIPDEIMKLGLIGILVVGVHKLSGVLWSDLEPLLDEMMTCIKIMPTPSAPHIIRDVMWLEDIEEVATISLLRKEVFSLHVGFSTPAAPSTFQGAAGTSEQSSSTKTSPPLSGSSSLPD
jgi:hypothetical protein